MPRLSSSKLKSPLNHWCTTYTGMFRLETAFLTSSEIHLDPKEVSSSPPAPQDHEVALVLEDDTVQCELLVTGLSQATHTHS